LVGHLTGKPNRAIRNEMHTVWCSSCRAETIAFRREILVLWTWKCWQTGSEGPGMCFPPGTRLL